jgi:hypothetical protein
MNLSVGSDKWRALFILSLIAIFFLLQGKTVIVPDDVKWVGLAVGGLVLYWMTRTGVKFPATMDGAVSLLDKHLHGPAGPGPAHANIKFEDRQIFPQGTGLGSYMLGEYKWMDDRGAQHRRVAIMQSTENGLIVRGDVSGTTYQTLAKDFEKSDLLKAGMQNQNKMGKLGEELLNDALGLPKEEEVTKE